MFWKMENLETGETVFDDWCGDNYFIVESVKNEYGEHDEYGEFVEYKGNYMLYFSTNGRDWKPCIELYYGFEYDADTDEVIQW